MRNKCGRFYFPKIKLEGGREGRGGGRGGGRQREGEGGRGEGEVTMRDQVGRDVDARD
jgi:hypothetical protein